MRIKADKGEGSIFTVFLRTSFMDDPCVWVLRGQKITVTDHDWV